MKVIQLRQISQEVRDFLEMPHSISKNVIFNKHWKHRVFEDSTLVWKDDKMHYGYSVYKMHRGKSHYYLRKHERSGFTLDEKGKLKLWFGKSNPSAMPGIGDVLKALQIEWVHTDMYGFMTKGLLERMLTKKITNPIDFFKYYLKSVRIKASARLLYKTVISTRIRKPGFLRAAALAEDVDAYLKLWLADAKILHESSLMDLESQCITLERKINYRWSAKRIEHEHQECTKILMAEELNQLEDKTLEQLEYFKIDGFELLNNRKRVFMEGSLQKHCLYVNYWDRMEKGKYVAYHVEYNKEHATVGAHISSRGLIIDQIRTFRNGACSKEMIEYVTDKIEEINPKKGLNKATEDFDFNVQLLQAANL